MSLCNISSILTLECQEQPKVIATTPVLANSISGHLGHEIENNGHGNKGMDDSFLNWNGFGFAHPDYEVCCRIPLLKPLAIEQIMKSMPPPRFLRPRRILGVPNITDSRAKRETVVEACASLTTDFMEKGKELLLRDSGRRRGHKEILPLRKYESRSKNVADANYVALLQDKSGTETHLQCEEDVLNTDEKNAPSFIWEVAKLHNQESSFSMVLSLLLVLSVFFFVSRMSSVTLQKTGFIRHKIHVAHKTLDRLCTEYTNTTIPGKHTQIAFRFG